MSIDEYSNLLRIHISRRRALGLMGLGAATLAAPGLAACSDDEPSPTDTSAAGTPASIGSEEIPEVTWALNSTVDSLNLLGAANQTQITCLSPALEGMLGLDADLKIVPRLAERHEQPDELTYVFTLREGVTFWDGTPLSPDDVVYTAEQHMDPDLASPFAVFYASVAWIKATGPREVTIKLKKPDALIVYAPAMQGGLIVQKSFLQKHKKDIGTPGVLTMGTGPYEITEYKADQSVTLERFAGYWGDKPPIKKAVLRLIPEESTRLLAMRSGEIDGAFELPEPEQWESIEGVTVSYTPALKIMTLSFPTQTKPWDDVHVRRAVAHSIDREGLVKALLRGRGRVATTISEPVLWANLAPPSEIEEKYKAIRQYDFDLDKAKDELAQSASPQGFAATIKIAGDLYPRAVKAMLAVAENLSEVGIDLKVKEIPAEAFWNTALSHKDPQLYIGEYNTDYPDPANNPSFLYNSEYAKEGGFNLADYRNARVDALLARQQSTTDKAVRTKALLEAFEIAALDLPYAPIWWPDAAVAIRDDLADSAFNGMYRLMPWLTTIGRPS